MKAIWVMGWSVPALFFLNCAGVPPEWRAYKAGIKCHLQQKGEECNKHYEKAIKKKSKLPGVHASFGSHLYRTGDHPGAQAEFQREIENHPDAEKSILIVTEGVPQAEGQTDEMKSDGGEEEFDPEPVLGP